jgi:hypothetical protein
MTPTVADTHVHIYPSFDMGLFWERASINLGRIFQKERGKNPFRPSSERVTRVLFLTESTDCDWFGTTLTHPHNLPFGWTKNLKSSSKCLVLQHKLHGVLHVVPGRQVVTSERLEVLGLAVNHAVPDGLPMTESLQAIKDAGGMPVVPWALGKWLFRRGRLLKTLLDCSSQGSFLIGDSAMRPTTFPQPSLMRIALGRGFKTVAGSDPLPLPGEEYAVGTYAIYCETPFSLDNPVGFLAAISSGAPFEIVGGRRGFADVLWKSMTLFACKKYRKIMQGSTQCMGRRS